MKQPRNLTLWCLTLLLSLVLVGTGCSSAGNPDKKDDDNENLVIPGQNQNNNQQGSDAIVSPDDTLVEPEDDTVIPVDPGDVVIFADNAEEPGDDVQEPGPDLPVQPGDCIDKDNDGYGVNCYLGADCDDTNKNFNVYCPPCQNQTAEGCPCNAEGLSEVCYEGDSSTVGIGQCQLGQRFCQSGYWSACVGQIVPKPEECNDIDDDCDGAVDEGVLSPCGNCDPFCDTLEAGPDSPYPFEPGEGNSEGVGTNIDGYLVLDASTTDLSFIWVANSGEQTISKLDTDSGDELGRYKVCGSPSRTAVDLLGNVYVGCRSDGGVAKIAIDEKLCIDKNNNGVIDTSHGSQVYPGDDECILYQVYPGGSCARALGVDKDNNPWVGDWTAQTLKRLDGDDGAVLQSIPIGCSPYGLVIDGSGIIWVSGRGCNQMVRVDPETNQVQKLTPPSGNMYGITVDLKGNVWMGHYSNHAISRYVPATGQWDYITSGLGSGCPRGMAGSTDGYMYSGLGCSGTQIARVDIDTLQVNLINIAPGTTPIGVALDSKGFIWAVCYSSSSAAKINPDTLSLVGNYPVGKNPYTYSDMTGYALHNFTAPQGNYTHTFGGWEEIRVKWKAIYVDADYPDENAYVKLEVRTAITEEMLDQTPWQGMYGPYPPEFFPLDLTQVPAMDGKVLQVRVWLFSKDKLSTPIVKSIQAKFAQD